MSDLEAEREELREHAADTAGFIVGPDLTVYAFCRANGTVDSVLHNILGAESNFRIDSLSKIAHRGGYRLRFVLEPLEGEG